MKGFLLRDAAFGLLLQEDWRRPNFLHWFVTNLILSLDLRTLTLEAFITLNFAGLFLFNLNKVIVTAACRVR